MYTIGVKFPSPTEFDLLQALGAKEMSGRDLAKRYEADHAKSMSYGTLYTLMRRLKEGGWVDVREDEDQDGRVRFFKLSGAGKDAMPKAIQMQSLFGKGVVA